MQVAHLNDSGIEFDDEGTGPAIVLLSGWCQDHRLFDRVRAGLVDKFRVVRVNWRGHGSDRSLVPDFGPQEQAEDVLDLAEKLDLETFVPISTSHGGWALLETLARTDVSVVPRALVIDWIMSPPPPDFADNLSDLKRPDRWLVGVQDLFNFWLPDGVDQEAVAHHMREEMASFGYDMWARSGRVIETAYATHGSPLNRMKLVSDGRAIKHIYSQPTGSEYDALQDAFAVDNPWFSRHRIPGKTHFPTLESPDVVTELITEFVTE